MILIAAVLRLWHMDLVEFRNDEAIALRLAENMARLGHVPLIGLTTSPGIQNPADIIYLLAPFVAANRDPSLASAVIAVSNVLGVAGTMWLGWRMLSPLGGLVAGLSYATNPWAVFYSRKVWNPDSVAPWAVLLFLALDYAVVSGRVGWAIAAFPIFAVGLQMHFSFALLAPFVLVPVLELGARRLWGHLALGFALAVLTTTPYLVYGIQTGWADLRALQALPSREATFDTDGLSLVQELSIGLDKWFVVGVHLERALPARLDEVAAHLRTVLVGTGIVTALVLLVTRGTSRDLKIRVAALLAWLVLPPLLTARHSIPLFEHYFLIVVPAAALLTAVGIHQVAIGRARWALPTTAVLLAGMLVLAGLQSAVVLRVLGRLETVYEPGYGPTLAASERIIKGLAQFGAQTGSQHLAVEIQGHDSEPAAYLARPYFRKVDLIDQGDVSLDGFAPKAAPASSALGPAEPIGSAYEDGVRLEAASTLGRVTAGQRVGLAVTWSASQQVSVRWEVALYDPGGKQVARDLGLDHDPGAVASGDVVTSWFTLETPLDVEPGQYEWRLRRVDRTTLQPLTFADVSGTSGSEWRSQPIEVGG